MHHPRELNDDELRMIGKRTHALALQRGVSEAEILDLTARNPRLMTAILEATYIAVREQLEAERGHEDQTRPQ